MLARGWMVVLLLVLGGCGHFASSRPLLLAQAVCGPADSTYSCCLKRYPVTLELCGGSVAGAGKVAGTAQTAASVAEEAVAGIWHCTV